MWQKVYNWFKSWRYPAWMRPYIQQLNDLMLEIIKSVGKGYVNYLEVAIIEASNHNDWSNEKKFDYVFKKAKEGFIEFSITLKDRQINLLIEQLMNILKERGVIK